MCQISILSLSLAQMPSELHIFGGAAFPSSERFFFSCFRRAPRSGFSSCWAILKIQLGQWPIGYGVGLRIKRSSVRIRPWPLRWVLGQGSLLPLSQGEAFTLASISCLAILVKYILAKKKKKKTQTHQRDTQTLVFFLQNPLMDVTEKLKSPVMLLVLKSWWKRIFQQRKTLRTKPWETLKVATTNQHL